MTLASCLKAEAFYLCLEQLWADGDLPGFAVHSMQLAVELTSVQSGRRSMDVPSLMIMCSVHVPLRSADGRRYVSLDSRCPFWHIESSLNDTEAFALLLRRIWRECAGLESRPLPKRRKRKRGPCACIIS